MKRRGVRISADKAVALAISIVTLMLVVFYFAGMQSETAVTPATTTTTIFVPAPESELPLAKFSASIGMPAVDENGNGVVSMLRVDVMPGSGRVLVNINSLLFWVDTQYSIQSAEIVAQNVTGANLSKSDIVYTIETNASLIEGPSAGAALTVATVAALENKTINQSVMMTGTISRGGLVGPVGAVLEKAIAAKEVGAKLFLVPSGQEEETQYEPQNICRQIGLVTYCTTTYVQNTTNIGEAVGIEVRPVTTIQEALKYFLID